MATTTLQERMTIEGLSKQGLSDPEIAQLLRWSLSTVRKWRRRAQRQGRAGLAAHMGRPAQGALSTFAVRVRETLHNWRKAHPGWGPKTLQAECEQDEWLCKWPIPSRASIGRWLKQEKYCRPYQRHVDLPQEPASVAQVPHQEWEMDARGHHYIPEVGVIALISLNDVFSRVKLISYPCWLGVKRATRHPTTEDYQTILRLAFTEWGLPDHLSVDHDSVFYDNATASPFPTRLHLWLLALNIALTFGRPGQATDQGMTERSHQTWDAQVLKGQSFSTWPALREALMQRRDFMNQHLPCASCGDLPPLFAHPDARQPRRLYRPEWEASLLDMSRIYHYLAQGHWFRKGSRVGTIALGGQVYCPGKDWIRQEVEITFDTESKQLIITSNDGQRTVRRPIQGITPETLIGELGPLVHLDNFQLVLPFTWEQWRVIRLCETISDTT